MKDAIAANRSVSEHNEKLHKMELKWCRERPGIFPDHICITFTAIRSCLEARDAKRAGQTQTATEYEMADFEGSMEEADEEKWREEREGKGEEGKEEEEEKAREEGDDEWMVDMPGNANDIVVTS